MYEYVNGPRIQYEGGATFIRVCEKCGRFVKSDNSIKTSEAVGLIDQPNSTCSKCRRVKMLFEGFI